MTVLSAQSVLLAMPWMRVVVAIDSETARQAGEVVRAAFPPYVDLLVIDTPAGTPVWRNRFVKSSLRHHLTGPFVYLDADTLVRGDLIRAFDWEFDVAAVSNHNASGSGGLGSDIQLFRRCGWALPTGAYYNAGVQFWRDTPMAHDIARRYHVGWKTAADLTGVPKDQPAFNHALLKSTATVIMLPHTYNAQINSCPQTAFDALVWHFFDSDRTVVASPRTHFSEAVKRNNLSNIAGLVHALDPWVATNILDKVAVASFRSHVGQLSHRDWRRVWLSGDRIAFVRYVMARTSGLPRIARRVLSAALSKF